MSVQEFMATTSTADSLTDFSDLLFRLHFGKHPSVAHRQDFFGRTLHLTPFEGCYGRAGWVACVNGSPPRGTLVILLDGRDVLDCFHLEHGRSRRVHGDAQRAVVQAFVGEHLKGREEPFAVPVRTLEM